MRVTIPALALTAYLAMAACVTSGPAHEQRLIVVNEGTLENRLRLAQAATTPERVLDLRNRARVRFPALSPSDASAIAISWERMRLREEEAIVVAVRFAPPPNVDGDAVADFVAAELRDQIRDQLKRGTTQ
jgi:hypothetical protein